MEVIIGTTTPTAHHLMDTVSDCGSLGKYFYTNFHRIPGQIGIIIQPTWKNPGKSSPTLLSYLLGAKRLCERSL